MSLPVHRYDVKIVLFCKEFTIVLKQGDERFVIFEGKPINNHINLKVLSRALH